MKTKKNLRLKDFILKKNLKIKGDDCFDNFSFLNNVLKRSLCFTNSDQQIPSNVSILITNQKKHHTLKDISIINSANPKETFYDILMNFLKLNNQSFYDLKKNQIHSSVKFEGSFHLGKNNIKIGKNCIIKNNVTINENTVIGDDCVIHENVVLGSEGNNFQLINNSMQNIPHGGGLIISNNVVVLQNTIIDRSFLSSPTKVGSYCLIDSNVKIGHGTQIGNKNIICTNTSIGGVSKIGDNNFIGIGVNIIQSIIVKNNCFICAGHTLVKNLESNTKIIDSIKSFNFKN